ncbi:hypothetical protein ACM66B_002789 [Microbotryomycetes sp. NB124-2]
MAATAPASQAQASDSLTAGGDVHSTRIDVIHAAGARILCVADIRGSISSLNALAAEHSASAIIHTGDFGFYEKSSLATVSDRTLKHLVQYSALISPEFRSQLLAPNTTPAETRELLANTPRNLLPPDATPREPYFGLSEFPRLLSGEIQLNVPVYTVWGACEDVAILEKIRLAAPSELSVPADPSRVVPPPERPTKTPGYSIPNLTVLDEATTRLLNIGGLKLRLFGLGGAVVHHKLFDNGSGSATIAGGSGTMWTTVLQIGELVDTAQKVYDPTEVRLLVTHASPGREGLLTQLALTLKADLTVSAGLHFRYGVSYNEFVVHHDVESFRSKLEASKKSFAEVWESVKNQVEAVVDDNQKGLLENALAVANRSAPASAEDAVYKNTWNWNLPDAMFGSLVLNVQEGRISSELKSQGFNFAYRAHAKSANAPPTASGPRSHAPPSQAQSNAPVTSNSTSAPSAPPNEQSAPGSRAQQNGGSGFASRGTPRGPAGTSFHMRAPSGPGTGPRGGAGRFGGGWNRSDSANAQQQQTEQQSAGDKPTGEAARAAATAVTAEAAEAATVPVPGEESSAGATGSNSVTERGNTASPSAAGSQPRHQGRNARDKSKFNNNGGALKGQDTTSAPVAVATGEEATQQTGSTDVTGGVTPSTPSGSAPSGGDRFASRGSARGGRGGRGGSERGRGGGRGGEFGGGRGGRGRGRGGYQGGGGANTSAGGAEGGDGASGAAKGNATGAPTPAREPKTGDSSNKEGGGASGGAEGRSNGWRGSPAPREPKEPRKW